MIVDQQPPMAPRPEWRLTAAAIGLAAVAVLAAVDLAADAMAGVTIRHALLEGAIVVFGAGGATVLGREALRQRARARAAEAEARLLARDVASAKADAERAEADAERAKADAERAKLDAERWRQEAAELVQGLSDAIDRQLAAWSLTETEQTVARLILKGLSHKEIAALRETSEATVRQQAAAVYRKSGLAGRAELAAFFLEDLLTPQPQAARPAAPR